METQDNSQIKQRIRERYKGVDESVLDVIPATPREDFYKSEIHKRVAVYARVSTDDPNQTSSYELQKNHYEDLVNRRDNWELVDIYADEGISGTSLQHRDNFIRMINDCKDKKIDLIVTKSVSRFARNIIDCIGYVRELKAADPPIGIFFETENIFSLDENSEMSLSFIATLAQEESHTKSEIMNSSIEMRFKRGIFLTPKLLGYDRDENGNLVINEDEANTVRLIFFSYLFGYTTTQIADALTELERLTKKGRTFWSSSTVSAILTNARYCGDVLARKTFTPNYLDHKKKKNRHDRNQYRQKDHHDAIISREDFFAVQKMIRYGKYRNKGYFPELKVVKEGFLTGYVAIHPKWAGFMREDYFEASESVMEGIVKIPSKPLRVTIKKGSVDLSNYELVRKEIISAFRMPEISINSAHISFNRAAIETMPDTRLIEILVMPANKYLVVRKADKDDRYALSWSAEKEGVLYKKIICGAAFIPTLYKLFDFNEEYEYKVYGDVLRKGDEKFLFFDMKDAISLIKETEIAPEGTEPKRKRTKKNKTYPKEWEKTFGEKYYSSKAKLKEQEDELMSTKESVNMIFSKKDEGVTSVREAAGKIEDILKRIGEEDG